MSIRRFAWASSAIPSLIRFHRRCRTLASRARDINIQYARFHIRPNELRSALHFLRELYFVGINLTVPHKLAAFKSIDEADESANSLQGL